MIFTAILKWLTERMIGINWVSVIEFCAPIIAIAALYFWAHDRGWHARDKDVPAEKQIAVDAAVGKERTQCQSDQELIGGITYDYQIKLDSANSKLADAIGQLYDAKHSTPAAPDVAAASSGDHAPSRNGRLYYADPTGAIPALQRAKIATDQAEQLIGAQAYIKEVLASQKASAAR